MLTRVTLSLIAALNLLTIYLVVVFEYHHLHDENHLFENLQAFLLGLGVVVSSLLQWRGGRDVYVWAGLALLCFSFLLRELDLERLPLPQLLQVAGSGQGRIVLLVSLWLAWGSGFFWQQRDKWRFMRRFIGSPACACLTLSLLLLICSALMDKEMFPFAHPRLLEELFEINAYGFMVWPALRRFWSFGQAPAADLA